MRPADFISGAEGTKGFFDEGKGYKMTEGAEGFWVRKRIQMDRRLRRDKRFFEVDSDWAVVP